MAQGSRKVAYAAITANLLIAVTKFAAAAWTGSSAMWSEGVHSLVDTGNQGLLLYGIHRASRPPDARHPWGHGRELYFWSFVVALLLFALGAGVSFYEGVSHVRNPRAIDQPLVNFGVLGLSAVFEAGSWYFAFKEFDASRGDSGLFEAVTRSKDPATFIILFEDSAALIGIAIAAAGIGAAEWMQQPLFDGLASIGIGALLAATAVFLAREAKGLLIGEPALASVQQSIRRIARQQRGVKEVCSLLTVHLGPDQIVAALTLDFSDALRAEEIEQTVASVRRQVRRAHPDIVALFIQPGTGEQNGTLEAR